MEDSYKKYTQRFRRVWGYIGIAIIVLAACWLVGKIGSALSVLVFAAILAFIYAPVVNFLESRFRVPRILGTLIGLFAVFFVVFLLFVAIGIPVSQQAKALAEAFPGYVEAIGAAYSQLLEYVGQFDPDIKEQIKTAMADVAKMFETFGATLVSKVGSGLVQGVSITVTSVATMFMGVVLSFWLAKDFPRMEREFSTLFGPRIGEDYRVIASVFGRSIGGYMKGLVLTSTCTGTLAGLGFWALGVPYSGLLGLITAVLNIIPYIGPWIGGILAFFVGLTVGWLPALGSILVTVAAQEFTDTIISPKVMQQAVSVHPALVIIAMMAGGSVGGILGMIAAVPLTAAFKGVFVYYFEKKTGRQLVSKDGALFKGERFSDAQGNPRPACDALGVDIEGDVGVPPRIKEEIERVRAEERCASAGACGQDEMPSF